MADSHNGDWWRPLLDPEDEHGKRRAALLHAAFDVIAEAGFEGLRTRAVATRAGVNIATLHYYFPSKQDLIEGLAQLIGAKFVTLHGPAPRPSGFPALDRLRQEFSDGRFYLKHHPEMLLVVQEFSLRGKRDPEVQKIFDQMNAYWRDGIEQMVQEGIADGTFRHDIPPREMFPLLMSIFTGIAVSGAGQIEALERNTETWILSPKAKKKLEKRQGGKQ
ncbi:MAG TPA: TetR/AcrR family transcriptional regulator [Acidobacteriaceae bacterium]|jgi:AcrR family transcriptional regulator|nr:TetR/AcrR family transcriptional regulator [Acidobacteriaceae bacterium]